MGVSWDDLASLKSNYGLTEQEWPLSRSHSGDRRARGMSVLQVGTIEPLLARVLKAKYQALQLPNDPVVPTSSQVATA
jgi:hypothetical protein